MLASNLLTVLENTPDFVTNSLWGWGTRASYKTVQGTDVGNDPTPQLIEELTDIRLLSAGDYHVLAITVDDKLYSWGSNNYFRTGQGTDSGYTQVPTILAGTWKTCSAGQSHSMAIKTNDELFGWGYNTHAEIGLTAFWEYETPELVGLGTGIGFKTVSAGKEFSVAAETDETAYSTGHNEHYKTAQNDPDYDTEGFTELIGQSTNFSKFSTSHNFVLGIANGKLYGAGEGTNYNFGNGEFFALPTMTEIEGNTGWTHVSAGYTHSLAIRNGKLFVCGDNSNGRTGLGTTSGYTQNWTQVGDSEDWEDCAAGNNFSIAIKNGELYSCGSNNVGATGLGTYIGDTTVWTRIGNSKNWLICAAGYRYALAVKGEY